MGLDLPTKPDRQPETKSAQELALARSGDLLRQPFLTTGGTERRGIQSADAPPATTPDKLSAGNQPVYFDAQRGWYQKNKSGQDVSFNQGGQPVYDEAKGHWIKPFDASPPKILPPAEKQNRPTVDPAVRPTEYVRPAEPERPRVPEITRPRDQTRAIVIESQQQFNDLVLQSKGPVLVDFGATWCGPCKKMAPTVDDLARQFSGKVPVYKVEVDRSPWAQGYADSYPTFTMFDRGRPTESTTGYQSAGPLRDMMARHYSQYAPAQTAPPERRHPNAPPKSLPEIRPVTKPPEAGTTGTDAALGPRSGFHSVAERDAFERFAVKAGYSKEAILRAESMTAQEWACFDSINAYRRSQRLPQLEFSPRVKLVSDYQADRQAAARQMTHGNPGQPYNPNHPYHLERLGKVGLGVDGMHDGENAAEGAFGGQDVTAMWIKSPGHLRPIKDGHLRLGAVSCAVSSHGTPYWTFNCSSGQERFRI